MEVFLKGILIEFWLFEDGENELLEPAHQERGDVAWRIFDWLKLSDSLNEIVHDFLDRRFEDGKA